MSNDDLFRHLRTLPRVLEVDLAYIDRKDRSYNASWKKRGGVGAFMMLARKWDRLESMMVEADYNIFAAIEEQRGEGQGADGTVLAEIRDLRRYLALVEAEMVAAGFSDRLTTAVPPEANRPGTPEDGGHHDSPTIRVSYMGPETRDKGRDGRVVGSSIHVNGSGHLHVLVHVRWDRAAYTDDRSYDKVPLQHLYVSIPKEV